MGGQGEPRDSINPLPLEEQEAASPAKADPPSGRDQREFTRVAIGKRAELRAGNQAILGASITSLSLGGLLVRCEEQFPMATRCDIVIFLVEGDSRLQIHAKGSVVRTDRWGMALKFSKVLGLDSLEGLHGLVVENSVDTGKAEREFQSHQRLRWLEPGARPQGSWRNDDAMPPWMRRARRFPKPRWRAPQGWIRQPRAAAPVDPVRNQILIRVETLPDELRCLRSICRRYLQYCSLLHASVCLIGHRSWEAPLDYLIELYPPARKSWFQTYRKLHGVTIPRPLQTLLGACNGFTFGDFVFFGIPPSMLCTPPTLDENTWQPIDIGTATTEWIQEFPNAQGMTYFAGGPSPSGYYAGYFLDGEQVVGLHGNGEVIGRWGEVEAFLEEALTEYDRYLAEAIPEGWWH